MRTHYSPYFDQPAPPCCHHFPRMIMYNKPRSRVCRGCAVPRVRRRQPSAACMTLAVRLSVHAVCFGVHLLVKADNLQRCLTTWLMWPPPTVPKPLLSCAAIRLSFFLPYFVFVYFIFPFFQALSRFRLDFTLVLSKAKANIALCKPWRRICQWRHYSTHSWSHN